MHVYVYISVYGVNSRMCVHVQGVNAFVCMHACIYVSGVNVCVCGGGARGPYRQGVCSSPYLGDRVSR